MRRRVAIAAVGALILTGCTAGPAADTSRIRDLMTTDEDMVQIAECMQDRGWPVRLENGAITIEIAEDQRDLYEADNLECVRETGIDPDAPLSEDDYEAIFEWHLDIDECLRGAGWPTPPVPSYEVFRSTYESDPWIPWSELSGPDFERAVEACPVLDVR